MFMVKLFCRYLLGAFCDLELFCSSLHNFPGLLFQVISLFFHGQALGFRLYCFADIRCEVSFFFCFLGEKASPCEGGLTEVLEILMEIFLFFLACEFLARFF